MGYPAIKVRFFINKSSNLFTLFRQVCSPFLTLEKILIKLGEIGAGNTLNLHMIPDQDMSDTV
jgi:hypothetical protein